MNSSYFRLSVRQRGAIVVRSVGGLDHWQYFIAQNLRHLAWELKFNAQHRAPLDRGIHPTSPVLAPKSPAQQAPKALPYVLPSVDAAW